MPKNKVFPEGEVSLATQLRYFRHKLGMNQRDMAEMLGFSLSLYTKLEVGIIKTTAKRLERIAYALHTTVRFLTEGNGPEVDPTNPNSRPRLTDETLEKVLTLACDPEIQATADKLAQASNGGLKRLQALTMLVKAMILGDCR